MSAGGGTTQSGAFRFPYHFSEITEVIRAKLEAMGVGQDWEQVINDFTALYMDRDRALEDYTTAGAGSILFATVAGDGTGDYTSIKAAIEDVATYAGSTPQAFSVIYVKPYYNSGLGYDEGGLGNIAMPSSTAIMVWAGGMDGTRTYFSNIGAGMQYWETDGFDMPSGSSSTLALVGLRIVLPALKALVNNTSVSFGPIYIQNCQISASSVGYGLMIPTRFGGDWTFKNSAFNLFNQNGTISTGGGALGSTTIQADNCDITFGPTGIANTTTLNYSGTATALLQMYLNNCRISPPSTVTNTLNLTCSSYSGTGGSNIHISDCLYGLGDLAWNISGINTHIDGFAGDWSRDTDSPFLQLTITDPIEMSGVSSNYAGTGFTLTNCSLPFCWLTLTDTDRDVEARTQFFPGALSGLFGRVTIDANSIVGQVTMVASNSSTPPLTISGHHNNIQATVRFLPGFGGAKAPVGNPASVISGHDNKLDITAQHWNTACRDDGYNNVINGGLTGQPLYSSLADARGDLLAAYGADDIRRLPIGSEGQRLTARSSQDLGMRWENPTYYTFDAKGDLLVASGDNDFTRVPVGRDQRLLRASSGEFTGVSWEYQRTLRNRLTANQASLETDTAGWTAESGCTIARSIATSSHGAASLEITKS